MDGVYLLPIWLGPFRRDLARRIFQPEDLGIKLDRLLCVATAICDVMQFLEHRPLL